MHPEETHDFLAALHPLGRMGDIGDVVEAVLYLETAGFVTRRLMSSAAACTRISSLRSLAA
jgi:hypothetical protein